MSILKKGAVPSIFSFRPQTATKRKRKDQPFSIQEVESVQMEVTIESDAVEVPTSISSTENTNTSPHVQDTAVQCTLLDNYGKIVRFGRREKGELTVIMINRYLLNKQVTERTCSAVYPVFSKSYIQTDY
ncbi:hypothetical protein KUTeg_005706 [Tegillarca granosa]|uniref:Uncharacterized protein n=1 Tax=Tegillarca granosa TaxID=220873 RepID=A0ABQ9FHI0_TEGGR|nr:hypothetical protein KUTeg_005706 [Tegillarca granosa]